VGLRSDVEVQVLECQNVFKISENVDLITQSWQPQSRSYIGVYRWCLSGSELWKNLLNLSIMRIEK
jgi:hypothetical protein